jgi:hypothetical protein
VVDDSNEHMLSVWDCSRGVKLAEIKVRNLGGLMVSGSGVGWEWWNTDSSRFTYTYTSDSDKLSVLSAFVSPSVHWELQEF